MCQKSNSIIILLFHPNHLSTSCHCLNIQRLIIFVLPKDE